MSRADSRARVLDAALRLIRKRGHATVTMAQIAKAARLSRQAVYLHFADRAELMAALARHVHERLGLPASIQRMMADAPTGIALIRPNVFTGITGGHLIEWSRRCASRGPRITASPGSTRDSAGSNPTPT